MLTGTVFDAPDGCKGIDANAILAPSVASALFAHGYRFAIRYVRRSQRNPQDITDAEAEGVLAAGLGLMLVQHVESESSWVPSGAKGIAYGGTAAIEAGNVGLPPGGMVWCDLEGVAPGTAAQLVVNYCMTWYDAVNQAGFLPGLYVGWNCGLTPDQLYHALPFTRYWGAYTMNSDQVPAIRGICMKQHTRGHDDGSFGIDFDTDVTQADAKGGTVKVLGPAGWPAPLV